MTVVVVTRVSGRSRLAAIKTVIALAAMAWAIGPVMSIPSRPLRSQPRPDSVEYADGAWQLGHGQGYVTFFNERRDGFGAIPLAPRYPFGTSAALAPFAAIDGHFPQDVQLGARVISALYVVAVIAAAWMLGGPAAAAIAALLVGASPFAQVSASLILSDALAATLVVAILIAVRRQTTASAAVAGALAGALVTVRLLGVFALPAVLMAFRGRRRMIAVAGAAPLLIALALYQWQTFGSPVRTGYGYWLPGFTNFSLAFALHAPLSEGGFVYPDRLNGALLAGICPCSVGGPMRQLANIAFYPSVAAGLFWVFAPPLTGVVGLVGLVRRRSTPCARFALSAVLLNLGLVMFYAVTAARFIAPAASLLIVYCAVAASDLLGWVERRLRRVKANAIPQAPSDAVEMIAPATSPGGL